MTVSLKNLNVALINYKNKIKYRRNHYEKHKFKKQKHDTENHIICDIACLNRRLVKGTGVLTGNDK